MSAGADRDPIVAIIGSRNWKDLQRVRQYVCAIAAKYPEAIIISGGAYGVDRAAEEAADESALGVISCRVDPNNKCELVHNERAHYILGQVGLNYIDMLLEGDFGTAKAALLHRNTVVVQSADQVVAFWDRWSTGTRHAINHAHKLKRPVHIYHPEG